jgi:hypothetical protein
VEKPETSGPAAYVISMDGQSPSRVAELLRVMALQHVEVSWLSEAATVTNPEKKKDEQKNEKKDEQPTTLTFPVGSYVIRMDQPYSRIADALLDRQYWAPDDPQKHPYDDTRR